MLAFCTYLYIGRFRKLDCFLHMERGIATSGRRYLEYRCRSYGDDHCKFQLLHHPDAGQCTWYMELCWEWLEDRHALR